MRYLLDVNVLIALIDTAHIHHEIAHEWFAKRGEWATCAITENGLLRIVAFPDLGCQTAPGDANAPDVVVAEVKRAAE